MYQFFKDPRIIELLHRGPLGDHIDSYAALLNQQNYKQASAYRQLLLISRFSRWMQRHGIAVHKVDEATLQKFLAISRRRKFQNGEAVALNRLLSLLRQQKIVPALPSPTLSPRQQMLAEFAHYLLQERRLSQATLLNYQPFVDCFLSEQFKNRKVNLASLRAADVTGFVQRHARRLSPGVAKRLVNALRSFFRHLQHRGQISTDLAACVPGVANWSFSALPKFLPVVTVQRVLEQCDQHTSVGRRNYAILLLLAQLGLRAGEVVALTLEDLDWDASQIRVRGKGGGCAPLPLPAEVGEALATYLRRIGHVVRVEEFSFAIERH
jgi:site-specific recombinase XerD